MRVKTVELIGFKRFDHLTIDLGPIPKKIVAMVGPNGCGKSSVFDAFEYQLQHFQNHGTEEAHFYLRSRFHDDNPQNKQYQIEKVDVTFDSGSLNEKSFYIRTPYRFTSGLTINWTQPFPEILSRQDSPPRSTNALDQRLGLNYTKLVASSEKEASGGPKTGKQIRTEYIDKINNILSNMMLDVQISDLGDPWEEKTGMYCKKGNTIDFPFANLSSGEKEVINIIIDLILKSEEYTTTVYCIDEPELHLNTTIQRRLLIEINNLIPANCQLWIATHSLGFMRALQNELKEDAQILDFSEKDFIGRHTIEPMKLNRQNWMRIFETALDDLIDLVGPSRIVYCEGRAKPGPNRMEKGLDAQIYEQIFSIAFPNTVFVSSGGNTELDQRSDIAIDILGKVFNEIEIWVLKDRDMASGKPINESDRQEYLSNNPSHHRVLKRFELENYLFDKEVLSKYCQFKGLTFSEVDYDNFVTNINNQNVKDDINRIKNFCGINTSINADTFKLNLSEFITEETEVYKELRECIFYRA